MSVKTTLELNDKMSEKLQKIASMFEKTSEKMNAMNQNASRASKTVDFFAGKLKKILIVATSIATIKHLFGELYESSSELEATQAKFVTVFNGMTDKADEFIEEFRKLTPALTSEARSYASSIQDLYVPMGMAREHATELTAKTMRLIGALTNFNNATHTTESVSAAMDAAITGQYRALKPLGIQLDAMSVKEEAVRLKLANNVKEVTRAQKAEAMLSLAYKQSADALAAYNYNMLDTKTKSKLLKNEFKDIFEEAGQKLLPQVNRSMDNLHSHMEGIKKLINGISNAFMYTLGVVNNFSDAISSIDPNVLLGVAGAIAAITIYTKQYAIAQAFLNAQQAIFSAIVNMSPLTMYALTIIGVVAAINVLVAAINKLTGKHYSAMGVIVGAIKTAFTFIVNIIQSVIDFVFSAFVHGYNSFAKFANFLQNVFKSPVKSIIYLFRDMGDSIIDTLKLVANVSDKILGTKFGATLDGFKGKIDNFAAKMANKLAKNEKYENKYKIIKDLNIKGMKRMEYGKAFSSGYDSGKKFGGKMKNLFKVENNLKDFSSKVNPKPDPVANSINKNTDKINKGVKKTNKALEKNNEENFKFLRELSVKRAINRFTTAEVKNYITNNNTIDSKQDIDGIIDHFTNKLRDAMAVIAEGA